MHELYIFFFGLALVGYLAAALLYAGFTAMRSRQAGEWATRVLFIVGIAHGLALVLRGIQLGHAPFVNLFESLFFYSWLIVVAYLIQERLYGYRVIGAFVTPLAFIAIGVAA